MPSKRSFLIVSVIFLILALCGLIGGCSTKQSPKQVAAENTVVASPEKGPAEQIIFQFNWLPTEYPVKFVALEKGFWAEQNLDVKIIRGYGSADTLLYAQALTTLQEEVPFSLSSILPLSLLIASIAALPAI
jgi:ABC-type nitrate/sulfonate/bicarbonate transport system substrate-binding protein